jgi:hypothetical protein
VPAESSPGKQRKTEVNGGGIQSIEQLHKSYSVLGV